MKVFLFFLPRNVIVCGGIGSGGGDDDGNEGIDETMNFINSRFNGGGITMKFSNGGNVSDIDITLNVDDGGNINRYENWQQNTSSGDDGETRWRNVCKNSKNLKQYLSIKRFKTKFKISKSF